MTRQQDHAIPDGPITSLNSMADKVHADMDASNIASNAFAEQYEPPNDPASFNNLGVELANQGRLDEALACYLNALALKPDFADAHSNMGLVFAAKGNSHDAITCYQTALLLRPDFAEANNNLGIELKEQGKLDEAMACFERALASRPDFAEAYCNQGIAFHRQGKPDEAIACYRKALALNPDDAETHNSMLLAMLYSGRYTPAEVFAEHRRFAHQFETPLRSAWRAHENVRDPHKRLRIGYVSPDFRSHPVATFIEPVLASHDTTQFEVFCYYNHNYVDATTLRLQEIVEHWIPCKHLSDEALAERIRVDGIDLLIDLAGHTGDNRLLTFARKPAPVQVAYLGYPYSTGLSAIDYRITDGHAEPPSLTEQYNSEQLWRLPQAFFCYSAPQESPPVLVRSPVDDNGYVTFGCFNHYGKVTDQVIAVWAKLLERVPGSRLSLVIFGINDAGVRAEVETRFARHGVAAERLILIPPVKGNHFALYNEIDIALDPFPFNGHTTSLDTLWMGVPFVTLTGKHFTSRMGVTTLTNVGLPSLVAQSEQEYVDIAVALALDAARLRDLRSSLRERLQASPLMNAPGFTVELEQVYRRMWGKWCASYSEAG